MVLGKGRERNSEHQAPKPIFGDSGGAVIAAIIPIPDRQPTMTVEGAAAASGDQEIIAWFEGVAENAGLVQTQTLRRIIELNHSTEYLQKWLGRDLRVQDLDPVALESLFTSSVPLASHADHEPYIQRIADGDTSPLLTQEPITMLSLRLVQIVRPSLPRSLSLSNVPSSVFLSEYSIGSPSSQLRFCFLISLRE